MLCSILIVDRWTLVNTSQLFSSRRGGHRNNKRQSTSASRLAQADTCRKQRVDGRPASSRVRRGNQSRCASATIGSPPHLLSCPLSRAARHRLRFEARTLLAFARQSPEQYHVVGRTVQTAHRKALRLVTGHAPSHRGYRPQLPAVARS
jgi:hypothetical protein